MPEIKKISNLPELTTQPDDGDLIPVVDISEPQAVNKNKRITYSNLVKSALSTLQTLIETKTRDTIIYLKVVPELSLLTVGQGLLYWTVPNELNGMQLAKVAAIVYTPSTSGTPIVQIYKGTYQMLSTRLTIDANETTSYTAAAAAVITSEYKTLATGQKIRIDVDAIGTGTRGLDVVLTVNP